MIKKLLLGVVATFALGAAAATAVVAAAFGLYALFRTPLGEAGAAGAVAAIAALVAAIGGVILIGAVKGSRRRPPPEPTLIDKLGDIVRERPIVAAIGALAAGLIALRNPQAAAGIVSAFFAGKAADKAQRRR